MGFEPLREIGKLLLIFGLVLAAAGLLLTLGPKLPFRIGRLPGDFNLKRDNFTFYFPLATGLLLSVVVSFLFWFFGRR
jgi:formate hydrogenlyase subunit 3/multisubunit Na+/H+ antiporter MnhD subunit